MEHTAFKNKYMIAIYMFLWLTGIAYIAYKFEVSMAVAVCSIAYIFMLYVCMIDIRTGLIPDYSTIVMGLFGILLLPFNPFVSTFTALAGSIGLGGFSFIVWKLTQGQMGMGDAKLLTVLPLYFGWKSGLMIFIYGLMIGALVGLVLIVFRRAGRKTSIPFAPFLMVGMLVEMHIKF